MKRLIVACLVLAASSAMAQMKTMPHPVTGAPSITDAPGRGEIDTVHTAAMASLPLKRTTTSSSVPGCAR